jgi:hypothetical protein
MSKAEGKKIAIKFTMPLLGDVTGNVSAFSVTGQEYKYINGPIIAKTYTVTSVVAHPTEPRTLLITVDQFARFNNVEGQLTVSYNQALGNLKGTTGDVLSFNYPFTATDLRREINPNDEETIRGIIIATLDYSLIQYLSASSTEQHTIKANALTATVEYTDVTIVNP